MSFVATGAQHLKLMLAGSSGYFSMLGRPSVCRHLASGDVTDADWR
jgi:hypothetical protein